jgi:Fe-Mn family superoxide dismutase
MLFTGKADLLAAIERDFGSLDALKTKLKDAAVNHFASGWAWLVAKDGKLEVTDSHDAGTHAVDGAKPLVVIDVWEHAYYIDRKNVRPDYVNAVVEELLNWDFAAENLARDGAWVYPA